MITTDISSIYLAWFLSRFFDLWRTNKRENFVGSELHKTCRLQNGEWQKCNNNKKCSMFILDSVCG